MMTNFNIANRIKLQPRLLSLKLIAASVVLASTPVSAQKATPKPEPTIVVGSKVSLASIQQADWVKGEGPKSFEPGKIYIFECWATWCGPCMDMIPHVNALHKKYYDKGLRVYGVAVWEKEREPVKNYVINKGEGMSYPVAFANTDSEFHSEWITAAGVQSIPHAFIVKNGKLVASTQASRLTESLIESLLSGDEGVKKAADLILASQNNKEQTCKLVLAFNKVRAKKDLEQMLDRVKELKAIDPGHSEIPMQELWILMVSQEWPEAVKALNEMPVSEPKTAFLSNTSQTAKHESKYPEEFEKARIKLYSEYVTNNDLKIGPTHFTSLSILQWRMGDKKNATINANKSIEASKKSFLSSDELTKAFERFAKSVNEGTMPKYSEMATWKREAIKKAKEAK